MMINMGISMINYDYTLFRSYLTLKLLLILFVLMLISLGKSLIRRADKMILTYSLTTNR
jgi:hypothetical protein